MPFRSHAAGGDRSPEQLAPVHLPDCHLAGAIGPQDVRFPIVTEIAGADGGPFGAHMRVRNSALREPGGARQRDGCVTAADGEQSGLSAIREISGADEMP